MKYWNGAVKSDRTKREIYSKKMRRWYNRRIERIHTFYLIVSFVVLVLLYGALVTYNNRPPEGMVGINCRNNYMVRAGQWMDREDYHITSRSRHCDWVTPTP